MKTEIEEKGIRQLSWKQPFATLMLHGKIETRTWDTKYRGLVLICASKKEYSPTETHQISGEFQFNRINEILTPLEILKMLNSRGKAIAVARLVDSRPMKLEDESKCFVEYREGLFCHVYEDIKEIEPLDWKGTQGWKKLDETLIKKLRI